MREIAIAALSIALGAAVQVSGFGGPVAIAIAWALVLVTSAWMLLSLLGKNEGEEKQHGNDAVANRAHRLGHAVLRFFQEREADAPLPPTPGPMMMFKARRGSEGSRQSFDAETMWIYQRQFAEQVSEVGHRLRQAGRLGVSEFRSLISPRAPSDIELIGQQLIELGYPEE